MRPMFRAPRIRRRCGSKRFPRAWITGMLSETACDSAAANRSARALLSATSWARRCRRNGPSASRSPSEIGAVRRGLMRPDTPQWQKRFRPTIPQPKVFAACHAISTGVAELFVVIVLMAGACPNDGSAEVMAGEDTRNDDADVLDSTPVSGCEDHVAIERARARRYAPPTHDLRSSEPASGASAVGLAFRQAGQERADLAAPQRRVDR